MPNYKPTLLSVSLLQLTLHKHVSRNKNMCRLATLCLSSKFQLFVLTLLRQRSVGIQEVHRCIIESWVKDTLTIQTTGCYGTISELCNLLTSS